MKADLRPDEARRIAELRSYDILDTDREPQFDDLVRLAAALCDAPIALVSLVDVGRQWFKAEHGLGVSETPIGSSICAHALLQDDLLIVPDTTADARFRDNPLCTGDPFLRFYAGALLRTPAGLPIGTLCVLDRKPRTLDALQRQALRTLADQVMAQIELRRALAHQRRLTQELEIESRRKDDFLATLSHELRNPLAAIVTALGVLARIAPPEGPLAATRDLIRRQTGTLTRLVDDLFDAARIRRGKIELHPEPVRLSAIITRAVEASMPAIDARGHRLEVRRDEDVELEVDPVRIVQVLTNLLNNAARYTPPNGRIELTATSDGERTEIRVIDNGRGIAAADLERIFVLFGQAEAGGGGLGIGLTLARQLVQLHGGTLSARSDGPNMGSEFLVSLPLRPARASDRALIRGT